MSFLEAAKARTAESRPGSKCQYSILLKSLDPKLAAEVDEALHCPDITLKAVRTELEARGYEISRHSLERHRRGDCLCPR